MIKIDDKKIIVSSFDELKEVLEEYNTYNYIFLMNDISITEDIFIEDFKSNVTIDGTYQNIEANVTIGNNQITVGAKTKKLTLKNMTIKCSNQSGLIYAPAEEYYEDVLVTFDNVIFNGTSMASLEYSGIKILNSIISIEETDSVVPTVVAKANHVYIGEHVTIDSTGNQIFLYNVALENPCFHILPNSEVIITSEQRELMNGTNKLDFKVMHDAKFTLTTGNGFALTPTNGCKDVLIDDGATFEFIENKHQRIPMWAIFGTLTVNEGANLLVMNTYDSTPSDNYNILFRSYECKIILNNPESFLIYTKNSNVMYALTDVPFELNFTRLNLWNNSVDVSTAGSIDTPPDYSFYKSGDIATIKGTIFGSDTTITSHNLDDITNFTFANKKMFSVGRSVINVHPINSTSNVISGHTKKFSDVKIKYKDIEEIVQSDEDGYFEYKTPNNIENDEAVSITSCVPTSFIYEDRTVITPFNGELTLMETPKNITFSEIPVTKDPYMFYKNNEGNIVVVDSRLNGSVWKIYASLKESLKSDNNYTLDGAIVFKDFSDNLIVLDDTPALVITGEDNGGIPAKKTITLSKEKGILLYLDNKYLEINEDYKTKIIWKLDAN